MIYDEYHLTPAEYLSHCLRALGADALFSFVFYRSLIIFLLFLPLVLFYPFYKKKDLIPERKRKLLLQFRESLSVLSGALSAGYSLENALEESVKELTLLYGSDGLIVQEFEQLSHLVSMNIPVERAMDEFAARSGIDEIRNFARILRIAKRSGGELVSIMRHSCDTIGDKIQVKEEILTMTASRRFEQNIMNVAPLLVVVYIDFTNPGFFTIMYTSAVGRIVMSVCLAAYLFSIHLSMKILDIEL
ncbi:MAG: type II secretion system F family protein [Bacillota bacterium]|nr:type II secretion system F family protein [Bacillota bacterium]